MVVALVQRVRTLSLHETPERGDRAVDREDVKPAVVVEVEPQRAESRIGEAPGPEPRYRTPILEQSGSIVDVQRIGLVDQMGHKQVFVAVGIEVASIDAHAGLRNPPVIQRDTCQDRHVSEGAVLLVDPQLVLLTIVGDIDVDPPVGVNASGHNP